MQLFRGLHPGPVVTAQRRMLWRWDASRVLEAFLTASVGAGCPEHPVRWLTVEDIRKQQRMRREAVIAAMLTGLLPYEQRGRIRYARVCDVEAWERSRLSDKTNAEPRSMLVHPDLAEFT